MNGPLPIIRLQTYGINSIIFRRSIHWNLLSDVVETCDNIDYSKRKLWPGKRKAVVVSQ